MLVHKPMEVLGRLKLDAGCVDRVSPPMPAGAMPTERARVFTHEFNEIYCTGCTCSPGKCPCVLRAPTEIFSKSTCRVDAPSTAFQRSRRQLERRPSALHVWKLVVW